MGDPPHNTVPSNTLECRVLLGEYFFHSLAGGGQTVSIYATTSFESVLFFLSPDCDLLSVLLFCIKVQTLVDLHLWVYS